MSTIANRIRPTLRRVVKRLDDLRYIEDDRTGWAGDLDRRWRYQPRFGFRKRSLQIGLDVELVRYKGAPIGPRLVQTLTVSLWPFPRDWEVKTDHIYYDGPHCAYSLGPVRFFKMWGSCIKCEGEK